jgi:hypothetical protein
MEKEFVSYDQAVALKELGFDEPCMKMEYHHENPYIPWHVPNELDCPIPIKQQIFRWFREKYGWHTNLMEKYGWYRANLKRFLHEEEIGIYHEYEIYGTYFSTHGSIKFKTYEEAENACIDKLIELAKK